MAKDNTEIKRMSISQAAAWVNPASGDDITEVEVRPAVKDDVETMTGFLKALALDESRRRPDIVAEDDELISAEEIEAALEDDQKTVYVAVTPDGKVLGQIFCEYEPMYVKGEEKRKFVIANIYVENDSRRQTIGRQLYEYVLRKARAEGCYTIELSCWAFDREGMAFFKEFGFEPLLVTLEKKLGD